MNGNWLPLPAAQAPCSLPGQTNGCVGSHFPKPTVAQPREQSVSERGSPTAPRHQDSSPWDMDLAEVRTHLVPGTVSGKQGWGEVQGLVHLRAGLAVESEKAPVPRNCCWGSVYTRCASVHTSIHEVCSCSLLPTELALPAPKWCFRGQREPVLLPLCIHTHTHKRTHAHKNIFLGLLECALASGCSVLPLLRFLGI